MDKTKRVVTKTVALVATILGFVFTGGANVSAGQNVDVTATLKPAASITLSSSGSFAISPTGAGTFEHSDFDIKAYTNSLAGYTIVMTTDDTNLSHIVDGKKDKDSDPIQTLEAKEGGYTCLTFVEQTAFLEANPESEIPDCNFVSNRWGIAVNSDNYFPVTSGMVINRTSEATGSKGDITTVKLGAKIDILAAAGTYEATLNFAIVANVSEYPVKVNFADEEVSSVTFTSGSNSQTVSNSGETVDLYVDTEYTITAAFADGHELDSWSATGGVLSSASENSATFLVSENNYGDLTVSSKEAAVANN